MSVILIKQLVQPHSAEEMEALSAAAGVCSGASRVGSLGFSAVSIQGKLAAGVLINPITGDSGADRLVPSELLDTQLRKSWT